MKVQHIAIEGKCFFINADMIIRRSSYPSDLQEYNIVSELPGLVCRGGGCIIDPYGHYLTKPVWDKETIIYAELDMNLPAACKMEHDAIGHYPGEKMRIGVTTDVAPTFPRSPHIRGSLGNVFFRPGLSLKGVMLCFWFVVRYGGRSAGLLAV